MTVEIISWSISTKVWERTGIELATPGYAVRHASVARHVTDCATRPGWSLVFSGSRKIPTLGSTVQWETRQASCPTGTVGPRIGIVLSPLNTNDAFYLSHPPVPALGKNKKKTNSRTLAARRSVTSLLYQNDVTMWYFSVFRIFRKSFFKFSIINEVFCFEQEKESIILVSVG